MLIMHLALLYSGGKDSSLAAYLLDRMGFEVKLVCATFGINDDWEFARESANALGFEFEVLNLERDILDEAQKIVKDDRYPRHAITHIHKKALVAAAKNYKVLSDGTRRDDKAPFLTLNDYRALEDGYGVEYLPVLRGFGHKTINRLCSELYEIEEGESSKINKGDYEGELRTHLENEGLDIQKTFPPHTQTRVISWRTKIYVKIDESKKD
jgi:predicted subunit of tRNA(5-methylaminomethyl-2-thiouridylate) methyltransferase